MPDTALTHWRPTCRARPAPPTGRTTLHRDGSVTTWNPIRSEWVRTDNPSDELLATMDADERSRVLLHVTDITYTWEHASDESRYLRGDRPADVVATELLKKGQVGVIAQRGDGPMVVLALESDEARTATAARRALAVLARTAAGQCVHG